MKQTVSSDISCHFSSQYKVTTNYNDRNSDYGHYIMVPLHTGTCNWSSFYLAVGLRFGANVVDKRFGVVLKCGGFWKESCC
ncbi:hypothetical protein CEXT_671741 [Caerostris extrusa]|uniref:Uncharacterized protein n=1 Tax=Caerostris extrusa TaxID=172846 RepID=A0AAV4XAV8_CAEEX|nr:hypothetical protein CEXT_671741 [Caerostris extrusa]